MLENFKSFKKLKSLSKSPPDLTNPDVFSVDRIAKMSQDALDYKLIYATERVNDEILEMLFSLAKESKALQKMADMQDGKYVNSIKGIPGENRKALHTATRDFFENKNTSAEAEKATKVAYEEFLKLEKFLNKINEEKKFTTLVQIGIGGSFLGPKALYEALKKYTIYHRKVYFISNVDPDDSTCVLNNIDFTNTLFVSVSKSGTTLESLTNEAIVREKLIQKGLDPKEHLVSVTGEKSPMDDPEKYLEFFYIWDFIGGRFSSTSMVGGVTLSFAFGLDAFKDLLKGASFMDKLALKDDKGNIALLSALLGIWNRNFLGCSNLAIIPYSQALQHFHLHLQQLNMESNGKAIDKLASFVPYKTGPVVFGDIGTNAQHSFFQLLHQGTTIVPLEFIGFIKSQYESDMQVKDTTSQEKLLSNLFAQSIALAQGKKSDNPNKIFFGNRPNHILLGKKISPFSLGVLLAYYEHKIAFQGFIWGINSFDQEGVQLGKVIANKFLDLFAKKDIDFQLGKEYLKFL